MKQPSVSAESSGFGVWEAVSVWGAILGLFIFVVPIMGRQAYQNKRETALQAAHIKGAQLGRALWARGGASESLEGPGATQRGLASVSEDASDLDPWSKPYQITLVKNTYGQTLGVAVWSSGPNGLPETTEVDLRSRLYTEKSPFAGDDIGSFEPFPGPPSR